MLGSGWHDVAVTSRLLVVQPDPIVPLAGFAEWLRAAGVQVRLVRPFTGEPVPARVDEDGLLVLGGSMSSTDDAGHPWLADVRALMRSAAADGRPTLGICLGGQLMAQAFGGTVEVGDRGLETGVVDVAWRPEVADDPLLGGLPREFPVGQMHHDMISRLPVDATWLASSAQYAHQAFRVGSCSWGLQFHPEVTTDVYRDWVEAEDATDEEAPRLAQALGDFARDEVRVHAANRRIAERFAGLLAEAARRDAV